MSDRLLDTRGMTPSEIQNHPHYNRFTGTIRIPDTAASTTNASASGNGSSTATKSPEIRTAQPGSSSSILGGARVGYGVGGQNTPAARERQAAADKWGFGVRATPTDGTGTSALSSSSHGQTSSTAPHHHHHHHHHHHVHGTAPARDADRPGAFTANSGSSTSSSNLGSASSTAVRPAVSSMAGGVGGSRFAYGMFGALRDASIDRTKREKEHREQLEREKQRAEGVTSPTARTNTLAFGRPAGPPSPTASRATPSSAAATPTIGTRPSVSPKLSTSTPAGSARPDLPLSGYAALGSRALPSPFEREKAAADAGATASSHNRSLSGSSARPDVSGLSGIHASPGKPAAKSPETSTRSLFGGPPPLNRPSSATSAASSTPAASTPSVRPLSTALPSRAQSEASKETKPDNGHRSSYSSYPSYAPAYMGFGSTFGNYPFGHSWAERERIKAREREREREREQAERTARLKRESQQAEIAQQDALRKQREADAAAKTASPALSKDIWGRQVPPPRVTAGKTHVEVLNARQKDDVPTTATAPHSFFPVTATAGGLPVSQNATAATATTDSMMHQVAPSREPRPYTYTAKPEPVVAPPVTAKEREYNYTPRDKRPRMDAAVDDARRGQANKAKKRKEDERARSPQALGATRDLSTLTREVRKWPEVTSAQVEAWLKNEPDLTRVLAREVYGGADWTLAQGQSTQRLNEGGIVMVRVNGEFLGSSWVVRGEKGWDETTPYPSAGVELGRGISTRKVWGTDVYTDDSDLGLVLIHAGWVRWTRQSPDQAKENEKKTRTKRDDDVIQVTVRVVPRLVRYTATERNGIRTRSWGNGHDGRSIVVEGVQRITMDRKTLQSRANRKTQLAELARERAAVFGASTLENYLWSLNGAHDPIVSSDIGAGLAVAYNAETLRIWLAERPDEFDIPSMDIETRRPNNMETHGVEMFHGRDRYLFWLDDENAETLHLTLQQLHTSPAKWREPIVEAKVDECIFTSTGLACKQENGKGIFIPIDSYRMVPFNDILDTFSLWPTEKPTKGVPEKTAGEDSGAQVEGNGDQKTQKEADQTMESGKEMDKDADPRDMAMSPRRSSVGSVGETITARRD